MSNTTGETQMQTITLNGVEYAPVKSTTGTRAIAFDRGKS